MTESTIEEPSQQIAGPKVTNENRRPWQEVVADKVATRDALIQSHRESDNTVQDEKIVLIDDLKDLTNKLDAREFTAEAVVRAYIKRLVKTLSLSNIC